MDHIENNKNSSDQDLNCQLDREFDQLLNSIHAEDPLPQLENSEQSFSEKADFEETENETENSPQKSDKSEQKKDKTGPKRSALVYLHDLVYLLAVIIVVFLILFRVVVVSGTSMNNTLMDGDYLLLVGNLFYKNPKQGDIIVASKDSFDNGAPIVKRVIATEGQMVDIDFTTGVVSVDGKPLDEPYTLTPTNLQEGISFPLFVDEGCLFVMGDNRNGSKDSRNPEIGLVDRREVLGKVVFLSFPGTNHGRYPMDFHRIGVVS